MYVCMYACMHACMRVCVCMYICIYMHTYSANRGNGKSEVMIIEMVFRGDGIKLNQ